MENRHQLLLGARRTGKTTAAFAEAGRIINDLQHKLAFAKEALTQIAVSYPETDEGDTLASLAREALKKLAK